MTAQNSVSEQGLLRATARRGARWSYRNRDTGFGLTFNSRTYRDCDAELSWRMVETWRAGLVVYYASATDFGAPHSFVGWTVSLRSSWSPMARVIGH